MDSRLIAYPLGSLRPERIARTSDLRTFQFAVQPVYFCSVFGLYLDYRVGMDELEEAILREATMSHHEIMARFKKLFGREMTPKERQSFFLLYDSKNPEQPS